MQKSNIYCSIWKKLCWKIVDIRHNFVFNSNQRSMFVSVSKIYAIEIVSICHWVVRKSPWRSLSNILCLFQRFLEIDCQHQQQTQLVSNPCYYRSREITDPLRFNEGSPFICNPKVLFLQYAHLDQSKIFANLKRDPWYPISNATLFIDFKIKFHLGLEYGSKLLSYNWKIRGK